MESYFKEQCLGLMCALRIALEEFESDPEVVDQMARKLLDDAEAFLASPGGTAFKAATELQLDQLYRDHLTRCL
jgi:hypothetical protein